MKVLVVVAAILLISGCRTPYPPVEPTQAWEGHYFGKAAAEDAVSKIVLNEGQSVWILSNSTLKRLLINVKGD